MEMSHVKFENEKVDHIDRPRDFEIIALESEHYFQRLEALGFITRFRVLEDLLITESSFPLQMRIHDIMIDRFEGTEDQKKLQKCLELFYRSFQCKAWIPFSVKYLRKNNNVDGGIRWCLHEYYGYHRKWKMGEIHQGKLIADIVHVAIKPLILKNGEHEWKNRQYDRAWHFELVLKILQENEQELFHEYKYARCWATQRNAPEIYYLEKCLK